MMTERMGGMDEGGRMERVSEDGEPVTKYGAGGARAEGGLIRGDAMHTPVFYVRQEHDAHGIATA